VQVIDAAVSALAEPPGTSSCLLHGEGIAAGLVEHYGIDIVAAGFLFVFVNNRPEGNAPATIEAVVGSIESSPGPAT
jgi:hypothetical protein